MTFKESFNLDDYINRECGYTKKVIYDFIDDIILIGSIGFVLVRYKYRGTKVNIFGDKIVNFNDAYTLFYKIKVN